MGTTSFMNVPVWRAAHRIVLEIDRMTKRYSVDERFGLTPQTRTAAVSIPANIAEGFGRRPGKERARFYTIAKGSTEELRYYLRLGRDLGYLSDVAELERALDGVGAQLYTLWSLETAKS
jgi:four helix bundle protein